MKGTERYYKPHVLLEIGLLATVVLLAGAAVKVDAQSPLRLRLTAEMTTLRESDQTNIAVELLDRDYLPVANDRDREVRFEWGPVSPAAIGSGEITPPQITISAGRQRSTNIGIVAKKAGRVSIKATSEGLESAQTLLTIAPPLSPLPYMGFRGAPDVQPQVKLKIYPDNIQPVTANGHSAATIWVTTDRPVNRGEQLFIRVVTDPAASILTKAQEAGSVGFIDIRISEGSAQSDAIQLRTSHPGSVKVWAQVVPDGSKDQVEVQFKVPQPAEIVLRDIPPLLPSSRRKVPFTVKLADENHVFLDVLQQEWHIQLGTDGDADEATFDPDHVTLSPHQALGQTVLHLRKFPLDSQVRLLAQDLSQRLPHTEKAIKLDSPIYRVLVTGRNEVTRGQTSTPLTLHLLDTNQRHMRADLGRKVMVRAERGTIIPSEVWIVQGEEHGHVAYLSPSEAGEDRITAESPGLEVGDWKVTVVTSTAILTLFGGLGGMIGGVIRQVFKGRVRHLLPDWSSGHLKPGLAGNALGSIVFGLVLFESVKLGLLPMIESMGHGVSFSLESRMFAFFCGVLGGFGGVMVLERMLDRVFPDHRRSKSPPPQPPSARPRSSRLPRQAVRA